ncbi:hypothetical protein F4776DRAFT_184808 [Hypoxylon sp. NC0597]|nr:hypothetical protein F4776DRAFT_184808 [Hypoxylon sp. NC0597]
MTRDHIDLTMIVSDSDDSHALDSTPQRGRQSQSQSRSQPGSRTRKLASPPAPDRQTAASIREDSTSIHAATPTRSAKGPASKITPQDGKMAPLSVRSTSSSKNAPDVTPSSAHHHTPSSHRTPKHHTPKKHEWTTDKIEETLRSFSDEIGTDGANLTARLIYIAWRKEAPVQRFTSKKDWFADMKRTPVEAGGKSSDTMKIRTKVGPQDSFKQVIQAPITLS